ncbi:discoidin domain-containing protein [Cohnella sp. GCM10027633]|uniref:discoidin domain-containing protein n=1 Tax=unclassified Cohnella TaxID=2636738 RepID=UPI003640DC15
MMAVVMVMSLMTFGSVSFAGLDTGLGPNTQIVVTYDTNGGSDIGHEFLQPGGTVVFQRVPVKACYSFNGWFYDSQLTQPYKATDLIYSNLTLYAKWAFSSTGTACEEAALTSTVGVVSAGGTDNETITIGSNVKLAALRAAITPSANATFEIYHADGITRAETLAAGMKIIVTSQSGTKKTTYTVLLDNPNVALNRLATSTGTCATTENASKAVDGSVSNNSKWCSSSASHWLQLDLGSVKQVSQFVIKHASAGGESVNLNTKAYHIQVSTDGTAWSTVVNVNNNTSGITVDNISPTQARYIKLNITTPTQTLNSLARVFEFEAYEKQNLALNKPATAGGASCIPSQAAAKAVDGSVTDDAKWCSTAKNASLQVDLGYAMQVSQFVIKHASEGGESGDFNTRAYNIKVSTDGNHWNDALYNMNNQNGTTVDTINPVTARYVKLIVLTPTQTKDPDTRIYDFQVFGPQDLALNRPATADSTCRATQTGAQAVDGSVTNDSKWCSLSANRWLQIDLGSAKQVNRFVIKHASEGGETVSYNTMAYNIEVSTDGKSWSKVVDVTNSFNGITIDQISTTSARYVKLNVTAPTQTTNQAARIYAFEVYGPSNLTLNKPATSDSACNASQTAAKATDGVAINDANSKWCSLSGNRWLQIDLGSAKQVDRIVMKHASEGGETVNYNTKTYQIQVSTDGINWKTVVDVTNNTGGITADRITEVSARYIKLIVTKPTQTLNAAARIYELEVYGPGYTTYS